MLCYLPPEAICFCFLQASRLGIITSVKSGIEMVQSYYGPRAAIQGGWHSGGIISLCFQTFQHFYDS